MPTASVNENRMKKNEWPEELPPSLFSFLPNFFFSLVSFFFFFFQSVKARRVGEALTPWSVNDESGSTEKTGEVINGMRAANKSRRRGRGGKE